MFIEHAAFVEVNREAKKWRDYENTGVYKTGSGS
jgi:hypothetical protein